MNNDFVDDNNINFLLVSKQIESYISYLEIKGNNSDVESTEPEVSEEIDIDSLQIGLDVSCILRSEDLSSKISLVCYEMQLLYGLSVYDSLIREQEEVSVLKKVK